GLLLTVQFSQELRDRLLNLRDGDRVAVDAEDPQLQRVRPTRIETDEVAPEPARAGHLELHLPDIGRLDPARAHEGQMSGALGALDLDHALGADKTVRAGTRTFDPRMRHE